MRNPRDAEDDRLVEAARRSPEGDVRAFEALVLRHQRRIVANCRHLSRSPAGAEDLAQEVFLKAYFALPRFEGRSSFQTWIRRIKANHCLNHLKKEERAEFEDLEAAEARGAGELSVPPVAERRANAALDRVVIMRILDSMSEALRLPLVLRDMDQFSYQEIADRLGIGLSAVKMRVKRAREEFRMKYRQPERLTRSVRGEQRYE